MVINMPERPMTGKELIRIEVRMNLNVSRSCRKKNIRLIGATEVGKKRRINNRTTHLAIMQAIVDQSQPILSIRGVRTREMMMVGTSTMLVMVLRRFLDTWWCSISSYSQYASKSTKPCQQHRNIRKVRQYLVLILKNSRQYPTISSIDFSRTVRSLSRIRSPYPKWISTVGMKISPHTTLSITAGVVIGPDSPIYSANSAEVAFRKHRPPTTNPTVCMMPCRSAAKQGTLNSFIATASSEMSCSVMKKMIKINRIAIATS